MSTFFGQGWKLLIANARMIKFVSQRIGVETAIIRASAENRPSGEPPPPRSSIRADGRTDLRTIGDLYSIRSYARSNRGFADALTTITTTTDRHHGG